MGPSRGPQRVPTARAGLAVGSLPPPWAPTNGNDRRPTARPAWPSWSASSGAAPPARRSSASASSWSSRWRRPSGCPASSARTTTAPSTRRTPRSRPTRQPRPSPPSTIPGAADHRRDAVPGRRRLQRRGRPASRTRRPCASTRPRPTPRRSTPARAASPWRWTRPRRRRRSTTSWCCPATTSTTGSTFHRIVPGFVVQGGDPTGDRLRRTGLRVRRRAPVDRVATTTPPARWPWPTPGPNTNGSQFFVTAGRHGSRRAQLLAVRPGHRGLRHHRQGARGGRQRGPHAHDHLRHDHGVVTASLPAQREGIEIDLGPGQVDDGVAVTLPTAGSPQHRGAGGQGDDGKGQSEPERAVQAVVGPGSRPPAPRPWAGRGRGPSVKAPPAGSVIGSHRAIAAGPEAATTAPAASAATSASHSGVSLSTDRRCIGESPTRYVSGLSPHGGHVLRGEGVGPPRARAGPAAVRAEALRTIPRRGSRPARGARRRPPWASTSTSVRPASSSRSRSSSSVGHELPAADQRQRAGHRSPSPCLGPADAAGDAARRATPATQDRSGGSASPARSARCRRSCSPPVRIAPGRSRPGHEAVGHGAATAAGSAPWSARARGGGCDRGTAAARPAPATRPASAGPGLEIAAALSVKVATMVSKPPSSSIEARARSTARSRDAPPGPPSRRPADGRRPRRPRPR